MWCTNCIHLKVSFFLTVRVAIATARVMICVQIYEGNTIFIVIHELYRISSSSLTDCTISTEISYLQNFVQFCYIQFELLKCSWFCGYSLYWQLFTRKHPKSVKFTFNQHSCSVYSYLELCLSWWGKKVNLLHFHNFQVQVTKYNSSSNDQNSEWALFSSLCWKKSGR